MSKEIKLGRSVAKGGFYLVTGSIVSRFISSLLGIVILRLLTPTELGIISIAWVFPGIVAIISKLFPFDLALTKYVAQYKSEGLDHKVRKLVFSGLLFSVVYGLILTAVCVLSSEWFVTNILGKEDAISLTRIASLIIIVWIVYNLQEGILVGLDAFGTYTLLKTSFSFLVKAVPIALLIIGVGIQSVVIGEVFAGALMGVIGIIIALRIIQKTRNVASTPSRSQGALENRLDLKSSLIELFTYSTPLGITNLTDEVLKNFFKFMVATYLTVEIVGNYNAARSFDIVILTVSSSIVLSIFPTLSKIDSEKDSSTLKKVFDYSVKYSSFVMLPMIALIIILAKPISVILLGTEYEYVWLFITLESLRLFTYGFGHNLLWRLLNAQGKTKLVAKLEILVLVVAACLGSILIPIYGVFGIILTNFLCRWPSYVIGLRHAKKDYSIDFPLRNTWILYVASGIMMLVTYPFIVLVTSDILKIIVGGTVGVLTYLILTPLLKAITKGDLGALKKIIGPQLLIGRIAHKVLTVMELIADKT